MVQYSQTRFDASFAALSDASRRGVLEQLGHMQTLRSRDLAEKFRMTLTGTKKHVGVLEQAGLVITEKVGRVRTCVLGPLRPEEEAGMDREIPPALGRTLRGAGHGCRGTGNGRRRSLTQKERVSSSTMKNPTTIERKSEREIVAEPSTAQRASCSRRGPQTRAVQAVVGAEVGGNVPAFLRNGCSCRGRWYRFEFAPGDSQMAFFGTYKEVTPHLALRLDERREVTEVRSAP